jgi:hypothetical protein
MHQVHVKYSSTKVAYKQDKIRLSMRVVRSQCTGDNENTERQISVCGDILANNSLKLSSLRYKPSRSIRHFTSPNREMTGGQHDTAASVINSNYGTALLFAVVCFLNIFANGKTAMREVQIL